MGLYLFYRMKGIAKQGEKWYVTMLFDEENNDDLPPLASASHKEKAAIFLMHALITCKIMCNKDAQCNTGERP